MYTVDKNLHMSQIWKCDICDIPECHKKSCDWYKLGYVFFNLEVFIKEYNLSKRSKKH